MCQKYIQSLNASTFFYLTTDHIQTQSKRVDGTKLFQLLVSQYSVNQRLDGPKGKG